jgi:hypothetical protein
LENKNFRLSWIIRQFVKQFAIGKTLFSFVIFLLATYGICGKYWFRDEKNDFFIPDFHVLGLFMTKKHDLSDKFFPSVTHRCR